jgi:hypothetical protein
VVDFIYITKSTKRQLLLEKLVSSMSNRNPEKHTRNKKHVYISSILLLNWGEDWRTEIDVPEEIMSN